MTTRRSGVGCVGFNGFVYAMGGFNGSIRLSSCEKYDPSTNLWTSILDMSHQRSNFGIEVLDDMIFVIGGYNGLYTLSHCECLDVAQNEWSVDGLKWNNFNLASFLSYRYEATELKMTLSGLKAVVVKQLPNVTDYIYKNRINLIEERRRMMIVTEFKQSVESRIEI